MKYETALKKFKTVKGLMNAFDPPLSRQAVNMWKVAGVVPMLRAMQLQQLTKGKIKLDRDVYGRKVSVARQAAQSVSHDQVSL